MNVSWWPSSSQVAPQIMQSIALRFTVDGIKAVLRTVHHQLFHLKYLDPKFPGYKAEPGQVDAAGVSDSDSRSCPQRRPLAQPRAVGDTHGFSRTAAPNVLLLASCTQERASEGGVPLKSGGQVTAIYHAKAVLLGPTPRRVPWGPSPDPGGWSSSTVDPTPGLAPVRP
jgi:hypothetical protein